MVLQKFNSTLFAISGMLIYLLKRCDFQILLEYFPNNYKHRQQAKICNVYITQPYIFGVSFKNISEVWTLLLRKWKIKKLYTKIVI